MHGVLVTPESGHRWLRVVTERERHAKRVVTVLFRAISRFAPALIAACLLIASATASADNAAQTIVHMIDYVGVDYPEAVHDGKIKSADEFKEMVDFTSQAVALLQKMPANPKRAALVAEAKRLASMVQQKRPASDVAAAASKLRSSVIEAYNLQVVPKRTPDLSAGRKLYLAMCESCHGANGLGNGPAGVRLEPAPSNFHDAERMAQRSLYSLYNTITLGVRDTGMASYEKTLSDEQRWTLAFYVSTFASGNKPAQGEALWRAGKGRTEFPDMKRLAMRSPAEVAASHGQEAVAIQTYLRAHPEALEQGRPSPLAFALKTLDEAVASYRSGAKDHARQLAITAYLEGFELAEASLRNVDEELMHEGEREMMALRALIARGASLEEVAAQHARTTAVLVRAQERLSAEGLSPGATFLSSLLILLREGLEAILVLAAIITFVIRANRREAMPYVHAGWGLALLLGAITWFMATYIVGQSGASREMTEGVTALLAAAMLIYVGFWLHSRSYARAWDHFIRDQVGSALAGKTLWAMALVSFLAVYRELFEVVLFYQALAAQAGPAGIAPLVGGIVTGALLLAAIGYGIFKLSIRLPLKLFFTAMSALLALLAVVFAGNGIAALQEAGLVPADRVVFVSVPVLGLHPTIETIGAQIITLLVVVACFYFAGRGSRDSAASRRVQIT